MNALTTNHHIISKSFAAALCATAISVACLPGPNPGPEPPAGPGELIQSNLQRELSPQIEQSDYQNQVAANSDFAFDMYHVLSQDADNTNKDLFFSPHSITLALAMTYAGARGQTASEMATALHFELPQARLHPVFNQLDLDLMSRGQNAQGSDGQPFRLKVANSIWGEQSLGFEADFLDTLALNYGAGMRAVDFINQPDPTRIAINDWVAEQTENRILDLIPQGAITSDTRLVLSNAIYFNASWLNPFEETATTSADFYALNGDSVSVDMMRQTEDFTYFSNDEVTLVGLPYDGEELSMYVLMPAAGSFAQFETDLNANMLAQLQSQAQRTNLDLSLPKWGFAGDTISLQKVFKQLGMQQAFSMSADFSGITSDTDLFISDVLHKAFVKVNEAGTEAAAATAVVFNDTGIGADPIAVSVDHPFIYVIQDQASGQILFVGRVVNPG